MQEQPSTSFANSNKYVSNFSKGFVSPPKILKRSLNVKGSPHETMLNMSKNAALNKLDDSKVKTPARNSTKYQKALTATYSKPARDTKTRDVSNFEIKAEKDNKENTPKIIRDVNFYTKSKRDGMDDTLNLSMNSDKNKISKTPSANKEIENYIASTPFSKSNKYPLSESKRDPAELGLSNERLLNVLITLKEEKNNLLRDIETKEKQKKEDIIKRAEGLKLKIESSIKDMDLLGIKGSFHTANKSEKFLIKPDLELAVSRTVPVKQLSLPEASPKETPVNAFNYEDELKTCKERNAELTNFINMLLEKNNTLQTTLNSNQNSACNHNCGTVNITPSNIHTTNITNSDTKLNEEAVSKGSQIKKEIELWVEPSNPTKETEQSDDIVGDQKKYNIKDLNRETLDGYSKGELIRISLILKHELEISRRKLSLADKHNEFTKKKVALLEEQVDVRISDRDKNLIKSFEKYILGLLAENDKMKRAFDDTYEELEKLRKEFNVPVAKNCLDEDSLAGSSIGEGAERKAKGINLFCGCV